LQKELAEVQVEAESIRTELRRRERAQQLEARKAVRQEVAAGALPTLEAVVSGGVTGFDLDSAFDDLHFRRESATEVRLGYASAPHETLALTDGQAVQEVASLLAARELYRSGWEFGTPAARGVRIYPVGSKAERLVPASEIVVERPR
jgi:hypothetical protein